MAAVNLFLFVSATVKVCPLFCLHHLKFKKKLRKLKPDTASGPDGIQAVLLQNAGSSLSFPLAQLYQFLLSTCSVPKEWKLASVTPIFKKGKSCDVSN